MAEYELGYRSDDGTVELEHLDGVPWWEASVPRRWHRCRVQSRGHISLSDYVERCACGAIRRGGDRPWLNKNERGKK